MGKLNRLLTISGSLLKTLKIRGGTLVLFVGTVFGLVLRTWKEFDLFLQPSEERRSLLCACVSRLIQIFLFSKHDPTEVHTSILPNV